MTTQPATPLPRRLVCAGCGAEFSCGLSSDCWCASEPARLPLPAGQGSDQADCLCPDCLRKAAAGPAR